MRRMLLSAAILAATLAGSLPAFADAQRDHACRQAISAGLHWGGQPVSAPGRSYLGRLPVDMGLALAARSLQARFYQYCMQGGRMAYWPYVHTFLRTNGFYMFSETADAAAVRMVREDGQRATVPRPAPDYRQMAPEGAPQMPEAARAPSPRPEARVLVGRQGAYVSGELPQMVEGTLYFDPNGPQAYHISAGQIAVYSGAVWYLHASRFRVASPPHDRH